MFLFALDKDYIVEDRRHRCCGNVEIGRTTGRAAIWRFRSLLKGPYEVQAKPGCHARESQAWDLEAGDAVDD